MLSWGSAVVIAYLIFMSSDVISLLLGQLSLVSIIQTETGRVTIVLFDARGKAKPLKSELYNYP